MRSFIAGLIAFIGLTLASAPVAHTAGVARRTVEIEYEGQRIEGMPLTITKSGVELMGRDGRLWSLPAQNGKSLKQTSSSFQSYSASVLKGRLQAELSKDFRIVSTGHYLVALPAGVRTNWAERFEELYRSFAIYFSVRGFHLHEPDFPLIAVVWPDHQSFLRAARADRGGSVPAEVLGYYSPLTNRIMLYDVGNSAVGMDTAATIIHEATHQTAFNTGIHQRFNGTPRWLAEGLGMMFEAPGVYNSRAYTRREDRINQGRLEYFRTQVLPKHSPELIQEMIASDRLFTLNTFTAYAEAWCLSFYLVETQPRKYCDYLALTARRSMGEAYPAQQRLADFTSIFGSNFRMIEAQFLRFMADLR